MYIRIHEINWEFFLHIIMAIDSLNLIIFSTNLNIQYFNEIFKLLLLYHSNLQHSYFEYNEEFLSKHIF